MHIYILDDNGRVVFEFVENSGGGYALDVTPKMKIRVTMFVTWVLRTMLKRAKQ